MTEILLVRHAQASFGAADYDCLSDLGHQQARALGAALAAQGAARPAKIYLGRQRRHRQTLEGMAPALGLDPAEATEHAGLDEFDAAGLMKAHLGAAGLLAAVQGGRRTYFQALRDCVLAWQANEIAAPPESWQAFSERVAEARREMQAQGGSVLAVSSGGAISRIITAVMDAPAVQMIQLQLQMKNSAVSRLVGGRTALYLQAFNEMPHLRTAAEAHLLTYA